MICSRTSLFICSQTGLIICSRTVCSRTSSFSLNEPNMNTFKNKRVELEQTLSIINEPKSSSNSLKNKRTKSSLCSACLQPYSSQNYLFTLFASP